MIDYAIPVIAYLFGSLSSAVIVSRIMGLPDPRDGGSKNPGATNVLRLGSKLGAALTLLGDVVKGIIPVIIGIKLGVSDTALAFTGFLAFLGHLFPVFFGFAGGKGVATALGVFLGMSLQISAVLGLVWLATATITRYSSLSALTAAVAAPVVTFWLAGNIQLTIMCAAIAACLIWRHKGNIQRLRSGSEPKIGKK